MLYQSGTKFNLISNSGKVLKTLPQGFYKIVMTQHGMWLEQMQDPITVGLSGTAKMALETMVILWNGSTEKNPSVMLSGTSGNGKTQTAFNTAKTLGLPTILVQGEHPDHIMDILEHVGCPVMLLFDEFEKNYSTNNDTENNPSNSMLTFLDGMQTPVKVFNVMTVNERNRLSKFLFNRPGRILFDFKFDPLTIEDAMLFISTKTTIKDPERLKAFLSKVSNLSYDICDKIAYVVDIYADTFDDVLSHMNIEVGEVSYRCSLMRSTEEVVNSLGSFMLGLNYNPYYDWYKGQKEYHFRLIDPSTVGQLLNGESLVDVPLEKLHVTDKNADRPVAATKLLQDPFKGIFLRLERIIVPKNQYHNLSLVY